MFNGNVWWVCMALSISAANGETVVDPAEYGFSPHAAPAANVQALQKALDGGNRTVRIGQSGVYELDGTVYFDDNTVLECGEGVVFGKAAVYPHMFANRGVYSYASNHDITLKNVELRTRSRGMIDGSDSNAPGLRGQVAFVRVKDVTISGFRCVDYGNTSPEGRVNDQYCIQFVGFENVLVEDFDIRGGRDGVHFDYGHHFIVRNGKVRSGDDGVALNAGDWAGGVTPLIGSISDGIIENVEDLPGGKCNFVRVITGAWMDWWRGMKVACNELVRVGKRIYCVWPMPRKRAADGSIVEYVSNTPPTHDHGVWESPEGIKFQYMQDDGNLRADIRNVVIRNCRLNADRGVFCAWEVSEWARLINPELPKKDYPVIDIRIENCVKTTKSPLLYGGASCHVVLDGVKAAGPIAVMDCLPEHWPAETPCPYYAERVLEVVNCEFSGAESGPADFVVDDPRGQGTASVRFFGNCGSRLARIRSTVPNAKIDGACQIVEH